MARKINYHNVVTPYVYDIGGFFFGGEDLFEAKTYKQLAAILNDEKGINIINDSVCEQILKSYGYFNLINNYKNEIYNTLKDEQLTINDIVYLREIDNDIQSIIFKNLIKIETTFKSHLSYFLANEFGVKKTEYTNPKNYKTYLSAEDLFEKIKEKKHIDLSKDPANYYLEKYDDLPPWVYLKHIPFGDTINIYNELDKEHKLRIINDWLHLPKFNDDEKRDFFAELLKFCKDFRDTIAHGGRLLNYESEKTVRFMFTKKLIKPSLFNAKDFQIYKNKVFYLMICMQIILPNYRDRKKFVNEITSVYSTYLKETENHFLDMFLSVASLPPDFMGKLDTISGWDIPTV